MAWSYYCADERVNITANTKEELAEKLRDHMDTEHDQQISREQAMQMVDQGAQQYAA